MYEGYTEAVREELPKAQIVMISSSFLMISVFNTRTSGIPNSTVTSALVSTFLNLFDGLDITPLYGGIHGNSQ